MANRYYVTEGNWREIPDGMGSVEIVVRIDVPGGNNTVGTPWQTAAAERWALQPVEAQVARWPGETTADLASGAAFEFTFQFNTNRNDTGIITKLETAVAAEITEAQTMLQNALAYWGKTDTV